MADVLDSLSEIDSANVVRCARVLLRRPLLRVGGPDGDLLPLVYRHRVALGVITETEGSVAELLGEALITIDTDLLGQLLVGPLAEAESVADLLALAARPGPRGVEHAVRRRLVEDPVTLYADLPAEQAEWLRRRARRESALLERCFGLVTESRVEGVAVTDPEDYLTDVVFPGPSTRSRIA